MQMGPPPMAQTQREKKLVSLVLGSLLLAFVPHVDDGGAAAAVGLLALPGRAGLVPLAGLGYLRWEKLTISEVTCIRDVVI